MQGKLRIAIIAEAIIVAIAIAFSVLYLLSGQFYTVGALNVLLWALWALVAAVLIMVFKSKHDEHDIMVRRFYLSHDWIYNHEIGYAPLTQIMPERNAYEFVSFAADTLARMSYGFEVASAPDNFKPDFLITSRIFKFHMVADEMYPEDESVVIDRWKGTLKSIKTDDKGDHVYTTIGTFSNAKELVRLIEDNNALEREETAD